MQRCQTGVRAAPGRAWRQTRVVRGGAWRVQVRRDASSLLRLQPNVDVLFLGVAQHSLETFLAADAGLLVAAERGAEEMLAYLVDPHEARLHGGGSAMRG